MIEFEIIRHIATLESGKELNLVSWSRRSPVYDLRSWGEDRAKPYKGITLTKDELRELREIIGGLDL